MKKWYQSKTIIVNALAGVIAILPVIDSNILTALGVTDTARWLTIVGFATTVFNIINRLFFTTKAIDTTSK